MKCFSNSKANAFENLLDPLQKLLRLSPLVAQSLGRPDLFARILQKLNHNKAVIRLNLLRIVRSICDAHDEQGGLLRKYGVFDAIQKLADSDSAVLVRNMAGELVKSALEWDHHYNSVDRRRRARRASSSTASVLPGSSPFPPTTPLGRPTHSSSLLELHERRPLNGTHTPASPFRPTSRDGPSEKTSLNLVASASNVGKSRLPRTTSSHRIARLSTGFSPEKAENRTPVIQESKVPVTPSMSRITSPRRRQLISDSR